MLPSNKPLTQIKNCVRLGVITSQTGWCFFFGYILERVRRHRRRVTVTPTSLVLPTYCPLRFTTQSKRNGGYTIYWQTIGKSNGMIKKKKRSGRNRAAENGVQDESQNKKKSASKWQQKQLKQNRQCRLIPSKLGNTEWHVIVCLFAVSLNSESMHGFFFALFGLLFARR